MIIKSFFVFFYLIQREAEENLPSLSDKEGIHIVIRDVYSDKHWTLKFK